MKKNNRNCPKKNKRFIYLILQRKNKSKMYFQNHIFGLKKYLFCHAIIQLQKISGDFLKKINYQWS